MYFVLSPTRLPQNARKIGDLAVLKNQFLVHIEHVASIKPQNRNNNRQWRHEADEPPRTGQRPMLYLHNITCENDKAERICDDYEAGMGFERWIRTREWDLAE